MRVVRIRRLIRKMGRAEVEDELSRTRDEGSLAPNNGRGRVEVPVLPESCDREIQIPFGLQVSKQFGEN